MQNDLNEGLLRLPRRRFLRGRLVSLLLLLTVLLIQHALVLVVRVVGAIFFTFLRYLPACHRFYTTRDGLNRLASRVDLVPGLWSKERRKAADAHDERQREKTKFVASWGDTRIALEDEGDFALFLQVVASCAR